MVRHILIALVLGIVSALHGGTVKITQGGWYVGTYESLDANHPAILIQTREDVYIYHSTIRSAGNGIEAWGPGSNVHVIDCYLLGDCTIGHHAIYEVIPQTFNCDMCHISGWDHGIYLSEPRYTPWTGGVVNIYFNHLDHCLTAIGFYWLSAITGQVAWNEDISNEGAGDQITFYSTTAQGGTQYSVDNNFVYGPKPFPGAGREYTAAAILTDGDLVIPSSGMHFFSNQVIENAAGGIVLAYSRECIAENNTVVSNGLAPINSEGMAVYQADKSNIIQNNSAAVINGFTGTREDFTSQWPWGVFINNTSIPTVDPYAEYGKWKAKIDGAGFVVIGPDW